MYIAMNRFKVLKGSEADFETVWKTRESHLSELPGFIEFSLLRGPVKEDYALYSSHTVWESEADFKNWTTSEQFRKSHARAGGGGDCKPMYAGHPEFEGFQSVIVERNTAPTKQAAE